MKSLKFLFVALALLIVAPTFTSCKDDEKNEPGNSSLVGTWGYTESNPSNNSYHEETITFSADGTFVWCHIDIWNDFSDSDCSSGRYLLNGSIITILWNDKEPEVCPVTFISENAFTFDDPNDNPWIYYKK
ncbi:MAG: lipocalin family protein [Bacteroidales bacterium]|nr:lipocalin family protein [Bacteroidales bacterium]